MSSVHRELSDKQSLAFSMTFLPTKLEFTTASAESCFVFEFASPDARSGFEQAFEEAKKKLGGSTVLNDAERRGAILVFSLSFVLLTVRLIAAMTKDQWDPEFLKAIPIMKTRSGMQVRTLGAVCIHKNIGIRYSCWATVSRSKRWSHTLPARV